MSGTVEVPPEKFWLLVRFRDLSDPMTVERVDPKNMAASFGEGVRLTRITISITSDPATTGILSVLPWIGDLVGSIANTNDRFNKYPMDHIFNQINYTSFRKGFRND